ncbi:MAG: autotransporter outer membrane beta-barrel domain-containing protein, partial [Desulfovibrionaceae bacterium]|nr:autotransporter outer membrane beta-barrel domain-containing protein [Desulfovibrionaceae bacterium]
MKHFSVQQKKRKRRAGRVRRVLGALLLALCLAAPQTARAADTQTVHDSTGKAMFDITFLAQGENMDPDPDSEQILSTRDLNDLERQAVIQAGTVWADILGDYGSNTSAVSVIVGTEEIYNAAASPLGGLIGDEFSSNIAWSEIAEGEETDAVGGVVFIGNGMAENSTWELAEHYFPVPITEGSDLATALVHEFGHLLGIGAGTVSADGLTGFALTESEGWTAWTGHLYDRFGTQATPGMTIVRYEGEEQTYESSVFVSGDLVESGVTFRGSNVSEVLQGALGGGLPVNGFEASASGGYRAELSHIELAHGLMSHQDWSNYTSFMEAELAVLQDLGYKIDRKNWFGYSVYNDGLTLTSTNGYWARTADGTAWIEGQANTATLGVGLHIYGSDNTITQAADLLACGTAGTGIRVDGSGNTVTVAEGTTVAADGAWGTGLLVSYGKNQTIVNQGSISALGSGGVAVRFDMGGNNNGDRTQYRGSWLLGAYEGEEGSGTWTKTALDEYVDSETGLLYDSDGVLLNLDGALVSDFDVSGTLAGSTAAVYIAPRAYAERINILNGASIAGDIVSDWD